MKNFKSGGGNRFGGGSRPSFPKKSWGGPGGDRGGRGEVTMHEATCATCNKVCEVPFRPVDGRPVYCKDHFAGKEDRGGERGGFGKREFSPRPMRPSFGGDRGGDRAERGGDATAKQLEALNGKLDRVIEALSSLSKNMAAVAPAHKAAGADVESLSSAVKKAVKKPAKAKKAKK